MPAFLSVYLPALFFLLSGCLQEAPASSAERTAALLISLLHDEGSEVRRSAAESLGKIGDRSAVAPLSTLLADPVPVVRAAAAQALGRIGTASDDAVVAGLSRSLEDPVDVVKQAAAMAIADIEPSSSQLQPVANLLHAADVRVRRAAIRALLQVDTTRWTSILLPALEDPDTEVRQGAVAVLGGSGDSHARTAIQRRFAQEPSPAVRAEAAYHMGELGGSDTRSMLQWAWEHEPDSGVRRWIDAELNSLRESD